mmetsp:Transcript_31289/g.60390  ORF Transcript_31289/g.60390 Transcript_31289/m.60390 type:complete len:111 (+) Transcript_31289:96-428(+)
MFSRMFGKGKPTEDGKEKDLAHLHIPPIPEPSISTDYTKTMRTKTLQENPKEGKETLNVAKFREIITSELELAKKDFADDKLFLVCCLRRQINRSFCPARRRFYRLPCKK